MSSNVDQASRRPSSSASPTQRGTSPQMPTNEGRIQGEDLPHVEGTTYIARDPAVGGEVYEMITPRAHIPPTSTQHYYGSASHNAPHNMPQRTFSTPQPANQYPPPPPRPSHTEAIPIPAYQPSAVSNNDCHKSWAELIVMQAPNGPMQDAGQSIPREDTWADEQGYLNTIHRRGCFRFKWPNAYQRAGTYYAKSLQHHHRDIMQRGDDFQLGDYYLSPTDGHLAKLHVQCTQAIYDSTSNTTWRRTFIRNQSPWLLQASNFVLDAGVRDVRKMTAKEKLWVAAKWLPACGVMLFCHFIPTEIGGEIRNEGRYDPLPYKFWGYPYHAKNAFESPDRLLENGTDRSTARSPPSGSTAPAKNSASDDAFNPIADRPLEPETLCFLGADGHGTPRSVAEWKEEHPNEEAKYVFVSYYTQQFGYQTGETEARIEKLFLHDVGEHAARYFGVKAYWVGDSCLGRTKEQKESTVWQISDVVRGAAGLAIALSHRPEHESTDNGQDEEAVLKDPIFREWALRVWTLPEVLLVAGDTDIQIYSRSRGVNRPIARSKGNFATLWRDAPVSRELIENYEGKLTLNTLELVTIALGCFHNRQKGFHLPGDMSYALMGLLRRRPKVVKTDTAFQAFARLSLANDSDYLLERLICTLPLNPCQPWYNMSDQWHALLWDIKPTTQVCGIGDRDTVIIDGAFAASIRWKSFAPVANLIRESWKRLFFRYIFCSTALLFTIAVGLIAGGRSSDSHAMIGLGLLILGISLAFILLSPWFIQILYAGKIWATQAWFFGFEGYLDIETIENNIFGTKKGRLKWSTTGSPLSRHSMNEFGECIGEDPTRDPVTKAKVKAAITAGSEDERIFTLVDTYTLTVTLFEAARPPVAVVMCGEEGGMQRALLCSYDWSTQTLFRESVLRMETIVLEQMARVGRVRLGLIRSKV